MHTVTYNYGHLSYTEEQGDMDIVQDMVTSLTLRSNLVKAELHCKQAMQAFKFVETSLFEFYPS